MTITLSSLLEGAPAYGVIDAKDGVLLHRRPGFEAEFEDLAAQAEAALSQSFELISLRNPEGDLDRLFIAPRESRSFASRD